jgi:tryptophanyl-tRNA synthetase
MVNVACRRAGIGCVEDKAKLAEAISLSLGPYREKRAYYLSHLKAFNEVIEMGCRKAREIAVETMGEVREAIKL